MTQICATAQYLGLEPMTQTHLMWLASAALCDTLIQTLPVGWEKCKQRGGKGRLPLYYYNSTLRRSQWEHPSLTHWRSVLHELQSIERQHISDSAAGASRDASEARTAMLWVEAVDAGAA